MKMESLSSCMFDLSPQPPNRQRQANITGSDNTNGAGGFFICPIKHGADIVIQSAAPWLSISVSNAGGVIVDSGNFPWEKHQARFPQFSQPSPGFHGLKISDKFGKLAFAAFARIAVMRDIGPCLNPFEAAMLVAGLETLAVRMERVGSNAEDLAIWLEGHERVSDLKYPGE
jgi:O-acetylhomoserine/O-acetylserine sulfhydrylase